MSDENTSPLPPGDIGWDGETLTAGGTALPPGHYAIGGTDAVLVVVDETTQEQHDDVDDVDQDDAVPLGPWVRRFRTLHCPGCDRSADFPPGRRSPDGVKEIRTCPDCGTEVEDDAVYEVPMKDATEQL